MKTVRASAAAPTGESAGPSWRLMASSAGMKMLMLPLSAFLGIVITRVMIDEYGKGSFAQYGLLVGISTMLPFSDLGMSAALMNAIGGSADPGRDDHVRRVLTTALRVMFGSALVLSTLAVVLLVTGQWPWVLGEGLDPTSGPVVATICLALMAWTMPLGAGQRTLAALDRNHISIALGGLQSPIVLGVMFVCIWFGVESGSYIPAVAFAATMLIAALASRIAWKHLTPAASQAVRAVPRRRPGDGAKVLDVAWPTVVQMMALPIAMQTDRLVLSHGSGVTELAEYNLASQMFTPIWAVVSAAGVTLWPAFARARATGQRSSPLSLSVYFGLAAGALALVVGLLSSTLAELASGGEVALGGLLVVSFGAFMVCQGLKYPLGMYLTDAKGLRYQAFMILCMVPVNLGISIVLARHWGAAGPVIGSFVGVLVFQVLANFVYVRRRLAAERA